ncbi:MAG: hypothetical protein V2A73_04275, partial [Pseudomonadota bacterium]
MVDEQTAATTRTSRLRWRRVLLGGGLAVALNLGLGLVGLALGSRQAASLLGALAFVAAGALT